ncbi:hypothetical protein [Paenibacillus solani]|uniref:hypothetical protein n=1 Tax=Paenibacillus solani TaxID=1705565 RepID=UPI003D2D8C7F
MYLPIQPVRGISTDCFQDLIISTMIYLGLPYQLTFSESMGFNFVQHDRNDLIGKCIVNNKYTSLDLLRGFHGVLLSKSTLQSSEEVYDIILNELRQDMPVIIYLSSYWNLWGNPHAYQTIDSAHFCLVSGIDKDHLMCVDPTFGKEMKSLPFKNFFEGNNGVCFTFKRVEPEIKDTKDVFLRVINNVISNNNYLALYDLANAIESQENLRHEFEGFHDFWASDFFQGIDTLLFSRLYFRKAIEFLSQIIDDNPISAKMPQLISCCEQLSNGWEIVQKMIIRDYLDLELVRHNRSIRKMSNAIKKNAELEEQLVNELIEMKRLLV